MQDLDSKEAIEALVDSFYAKVLKDDVLAHIFTDVAGININEHKAIIVSYWQKMLLSDTSYKRHTMNIHRAVHEKFAFTQEAFDRWLLLFTQTIEENFAGAKAERAKTLGATIAHNMHALLNNKLDKTKPMP